MKGWLIYDSFSIKRNIGFADMLINNFKESGIELILKISEDITYSALPDFAIMRSYDYKISERLEAFGIRVFNNSKVSFICNDKYETYLFYKDKKIPLMETVLIDKISSPPFDFPFVIKPVDGHGGEGVTLITNDDEFRRINLNRKTIAQKSASDKGKDLRVYVMGNRILKGMLRVSKTDFRSNFSLGGKAYVHEPNNDEKKVIEEVLSHLYFDFAGIDIIYDNGKPVLNEIEDVVGSRMLYNYTDIDAAKLYTEYIINYLK